MVKGDSRRSGCPSIRAASQPGRLVRKGLKRPTYVGLRKDTPADVRGRQGCLDVERSGLRLSVSLSDIGGHNESHCVGSRSMEFAGQAIQFLGRI